MVSLFSGVGTQERGITNSDLFTVEVLATSDIDKEAIVSYAAVHNGLSDEIIEKYPYYPSRKKMIEELKLKNIGYDFKKNKMYDWDRLGRRKGICLEKYWLAMRLSNNMGDVRGIKNLPKCDLLTFSFPCQSISISGKQEGIIAGKTRSGLVYEVLRLIKKAKDNDILPKYLLLENVSALVSKKFIGDFNNINAFFDEIGYNVYWSLINGKDCGVPQNRNRCFAVYIRKDIDMGKFTFPKPFDNGVRLKDVLEDDVDKKYYLSDKVIRNFKNFSTVRGNVIKVIGTLKPEKNVQDKVRVLDTSGMSQSLRATDYKSPVKILSDVSNFGIRKLTPKECWRLMGLSDSDYDKASAVGVANTNLYKQAGNGIITNCVKSLAEHLYKAQYDDTYICTDENFQ